MPQDAPTASRPRLLSLALVTVALGMFLVQLDATVVNLALPDIAGDFAVPAHQLQWVNDGYTLPLAAFLLVAGRMGDRCGHRRVFLVGLIVFGLGSLLCVLAWSLPSLLVPRVLQGFGAALELPASLALLAKAYPDPLLRSRAIGIWASVGGLALAIGPLVGGPLVDLFGWKSVFAINLPIVALACVLTRLGVPADRGDSRIELNPRSQMCATLVLAIVTVAIVDVDRIIAAPWLWAVVLGLLLIGVLGFLSSERRARSPLLPVEVLGHSASILATLGAFAMGYALFGILFIYSLQFQTIWSESAAVAGLRYLPLVLVFIIVGPIAGRIGVARRPFAATVAGLLLLTSAMGYLALLPSSTAFAPIAMAFAVIGVGYGLLSTTLAVVAVDSIPESLHGLGSSVNNTARQFGGVLGVAVAGNLFDLSPDLPNPTSASNAVAAGLTLLTAVIALVIMVRRTTTNSNTTSTGAIR
ncbi:MAG: MFS transporter [Brevibacterium sp.]